MNSRPYSEHRIGLHRLSFPSNSQALANVTCLLKDHFEYWAYNITAGYDATLADWRYSFDFLPAGDPITIRQQFSRFVESQIVPGLSHDGEHPLFLSKEPPTVENLREFLEERKRQEDQKIKDANLTEGTYLDSIIVTAQNSADVQVCLIVYVDDKEYLPAVTNLIMDYDSSSMVVEGLILEIRTGCDSVSGTLREFTNVLPHGDQDLCGVSLSWHAPSRQLEIAALPSCRDILRKIVRENELRELHAPDHIQGYQIRPKYLGATGLCHLSQYLAERGVSIASIFTVVPSLVPARTLLCIGTPHSLIN